MKHTPGPWEQRGNEIVHEGQDGLAICKLAFGVVSPAPVFDYFNAVHLKHRERVEANARLIAAAPDLLVALESIVKLGGNLPDERLTDRTGPNDAAHRGEMYCMARRAARAAVAKARGEGET